MRIDVIELATVARTHNILTEEVKNVIKTAIYNEQNRKMKRYEQKLLDQANELFYQINK